MDRASLISKIGTLANAIGSMAPVFDTPENVLKSKDADFLYEVLCYFFMISKLRSGTVITYVKGQLGHALPGRHGSKWKHSHFEVAVPSGERLHLCMATYILDAYDAKRAPDISLQQATSDTTPRYENIIAIWDAKHRKAREEDRVTRGDFEKFRGDVEVLRIPPPSAGDLTERVCSPEFSVSALITNGLPPGEPAARFLDLGFSCVAKFTGEAGPVPNPPRTQHYTRSTAKRTSPSAQPPAMAASPSAIALFASVAPDGQHPQGET
ncbi:hypothetical protein [Polyangium spumosum]|uniref:Uncharacterized protein n=1 Tax=Polyangium spumosum TaxID=889282 RepID=A0A6N7Q2Z9_9BACT|nr:hypothetical protein [Polyangium spumosum]MRG98409.1 hypothetical protein [Polyangium spumosum]